MLKIEHLHKSFEGVDAVQDLSFEVGRGEVFGLLGPNGAGKTTTIRMIIQMIKPDAGRILIEGREIAPDFKDRIGYMPEERGLYRKSRVREILLYLAALKNVPKETAVSRMKYWMDRLEMTDTLTKRCEELSKGNQQKIQWISALLHEPQLLVLDEPFAGLDPVNQILFRDLIAELGAKGQTVLLSAHQMDHIEKMCRRICLIHRGRSVAYDVLDDLRKPYDDGRVRIHAEENEMDKLVAAGLLESMNRFHGYLEGKLTGGHSFADLLQCVAQTANVRSVEYVRPTLEEIFIQLVK